MAVLSNTFCSLHFVRYRGPTTPHPPKRARFGLFPVRSPLQGESFLFSLPTATKMFQFTAFASRLLGMTVLQTDGLSHSEICGSMAICTSPQLFAAYRVLHRLREPRHPPCALFCFFRLSRQSYFYSCPNGSYFQLFLACVIALFSLLLFSFRLLSKSQHVKDLCDASFFFTFPEDLSWRITDSNR